ncbi:MAG: hypothetical protein WD845_13920 [Pirellulales bacterium]
MVQLLVDHPWLLVCILAAGVIVICVAIVTITGYLRESQQAEIDATLKQEMIQRGMTAADIKAVLEARTDGEAMRLTLGGNQGVRVGLGKFQVEVGGAANRPSDSPAAGA